MKQFPQAVPLPVVQEPTVSKALSAATSYKAHIPPAKQGYARGSITASTMQPDAGA